MLIGRAEYRDRSKLTIADFMSKKMIAEVVKGLNSYFALVGFDNLVVLLESTLDQHYVSWGKNKI